MMSYKAVSRLIAGIFFLAILGCAHGTHAQQKTPNLPGDVAISVQLVASGFNQPINVTNAHDGSGRLFVIERHGKIRIVQGGNVLPTPFLDITSLAESHGQEQGLLDVAFDPAYTTNGFFYIDYTAVATGGGTVVARYHVSADPNAADPSSAKIVLQFPQPYANHNGGCLQFGPDGYLYISTGDGGSKGDPQGNGQKLNLYLSKMLRIDVNVANPTPYKIPPSNPFVGNDNAKPETSAYGLRNPWQIHFDSATGDLYIADVGQDKWEEIDFQPSGDKGGENYGWSLMEAMHCYPSDPCTPTGVLPVAEYGHDVGCSITGIGVYRGTAIPGLNGVYLAGDYCTGRIWELAKDRAETGFSKSSRRCRCR